MNHAHGPHGHAHAHAHGVSEGPTFRPAEARAKGPELARGSGRGQILYFDCASGISGDMILAALLDLGVPKVVFEDALSAVGLAREARLVVEQGHMGVLFATRVKVEVQGEPAERTYAFIRALLEASTLDVAVQSAALAVFDRLAHAEAEVHGTTAADVTFHEVGATDSIADVVGAAAGLDFIGADLVVSPLPLGRGFVLSQHGRLPLPAPATLLCLEGVPTVSDPLELELVTPTGAAIVATLAKGFGGFPSMIPGRVGWGSGTMVLSDRPNALRAVLGAGQPGGGALDRVVELEANIDDMTGELLSHALGRLLEAGALDAWLTPITMKKGRPAFMLSALAYGEQVAAVERAYFEETTTLGVRRREAVRRVLDRAIEEVETRYGTVPVKVSGSPPHQVKPEFDACRALAEKHGVSVRVVLEEALLQARSRR